MEFGADVCDDRLNRQSIAENRMAWDPALVRGISCSVALALLAGCGGDWDPDAAAIDIVPITAEVRPEPAPARVAWPACETPVDHWSGNRWWGQVALCSDEVRVVIVADSVELHGPEVRMEIYTLSCPTGRPAGGTRVDRMFFERPFEVQLGEIKRMVTRSLAQIDDACGGPADATALLGRQFDEEFRGLADRYWLDLPAAARHRSWRS